MLLVGNGPDIGFVKNFAKNSTKRIVLLDETINVYSYYNLMDIFVLPSKVEPFGLVLIEAGMMKLPVIASNVDGIPEIIENNKCGLLFEPEDINELAEKIRFLLENVDVRKEVGQNLYKLVLSKFSSEENIKKIKSLYC